MSKILIIGGSSFLGYALMEELSKEHDVTGTYNSKEKSGMIKLDMNNTEELEQVLTGQKPQVVILAAAESTVDSYENDSTVPQDQITSAENISVWCEKNECLLVFISTDFVFNGEQGNYSETDATQPLGGYGKNKLDVETVVKKIPLHLILRVSTLYGLPFATKKYVNSAIEKLSKGESVTAVTDWIRSPTLTRDIGTAINQLIQKKQTGLFHATGSSQLSTFDTTIAIAKEFDASLDLVKKIKGEELNLAFPRPKDTSLNISKLESLGIKMSTVEEGLKFIHKNMEN